MSTPIETAAEALADAYLDEVKGDEDHHYEAATTGARAVLASLAQHRDNIARSLALVDGLVNPPLSGKYGKYADAVLAYLTMPEAASAGPIDAVPGVERGTTRPAVSHPTSSTAGLAALAPHRARRR